MCIVSIITGPWLRHLLVLMLQEPIDEGEEMQGRNLDDVVDGDVEIGEVTPTERKPAQPARKRSVYVALTSAPFHKRLVRNE